jgi:hypothetical protein
LGLLSDLFDGLHGDTTVDYTHFYVESDTSPSFVVPDKENLRVWLRAARIVDVSRWTRRFHATVHARFAFPDRAAGEWEVIGVIAPDKAFEALDPAHLDRFITVNQPLLGPIPFRGELSLEVALFSIVATDLAKPYLDLLSELTNAASISFLTQVKPFIEPIRRGAELLFRGNDAQLEIGLDRRDRQVRVGNIMVARAPKGSLAQSSYSLDPTDFRLIDREGKPVQEFPFLVIGIEASTERPDYPTIPEIKTGWEAVRSAASEGHPVEEVRQRFDQLRRAIWLSPDLIQTDKKRIADVFNREISDAGYDVAPPREAVANLESFPSTRPLGDAGALLERPRTPTPEGVNLAGPARQISMAELQRMMRDPNVPEAGLREYFTATPQTSRPFAPSVIPDPSRVTVDAPADELEGVMMMNWANDLCRLRRHEKFLQRRNAGDRRPVLVSEGDSWFQFPIFLEDVIDNLFRDFNIWSVDAAGDTLDNMVIDHPEYVTALRRYASEVRAFLFSGSGNDIVGEDVHGNAIIPQLLRSFEAGRPAAWYVDTEAFAEKLRSIEDRYRKVISTVSKEFPGLPVICHGYDYAIPGGGPGEWHHPLWAKIDQWIGRAMRDELKIVEPQLQRDIVREMIDRFNERIQTLCGGNNANGAFRNAWHVDVRSMLSQHLWANELHPTDPGYVQVSQKFLSVLRQAIPGLEIAALTELSAINPGDDSDLHPSEQADAYEGSLLESVTPWRVAESLLQLRRQINVNFPNRNRQSDGTIGDAAHAARYSDHNPWVMNEGIGIVTGMDITHDLRGGCSGDWLSQTLRASRDPRIKYIIWNSICSSMCRFSPTRRPTTSKLTGSFPLPEASAPHLSIANHARS